MAEENFTMPDGIQVGFIDSVHSYFTKYVFNWYQWPIHVVCELKAMWSNLLFWYQDDALVVHALFRKEKKCILVVGDNKKAILTNRLELM